MDLEAYAQIEHLSKIMEINGIEVPRLRGLRLMRYEPTVTEEDIQVFIQDINCWIYEKMCNSTPRFHPESNWVQFSSATKRLEEKYLIEEEEVLPDGRTYMKTVGFRWDLIHGKNRKRLKLALKHAEKRVREQMRVFNKYVGKEDVLYIHARIGGRNWAYYGGPELAKQPWFIEKVDDYFDSTYCDIYARIKNEL